MSDSKKPEIIVFAGPNGSGKSTITKMAKIIEPYINADEMNALPRKHLGYATPEELFDEFLDQVYSVVKVHVA